MEATFEGGQGPEGALAPYMEWIHSLQSNINTDMIHQLILSCAFDVILACCTDCSEVASAAVVVVVRLENCG